MEALELLNRRLEERKQMSLAALGQGSAKDFADYKEVCGLVRGLAAAQMEINDLLRTMKDINED